MIPRPQGPACDGEAFEGFFFGRQSNTDWSGFTPEPVPDMFVGSNMQTPTIAQTHSGTIRNHR